MRPADDKYSLVLDECGQLQSSMTYLPIQLSYATTAGHEGVFVSNSWLDLVVIDSIRFLHSLDLSASAASCVRIDPAELFPAGSLDSKVQLSAHHLTRRYKVLRQLGDGTYGSVWKAVNRQSGEVVS